MVIETTTIGTTARRMVADNAGKCFDLPTHHPHRRAAIRALRSEFHLLALETGLHWLTCRLGRAHLHAVIQHSEL